MKNKDYIKIKLLSLICLTLISIILLYISLRIFLSILKVFIYINGLINIFILVIFIIGIVIYNIYRICRKFNPFNRINITYMKILNRAISFQFKSVLILTLVNLILGLINHFINIK